MRRRRCPQRSGRAAAGRPDRAAGAVRAARRVEARGHGAALVHVTVPHVRAIGGVARDTVVKAADVAAGATSELDGAQVRPLPRPERSRRRAGAARHGGGGAAHRTRSSRLPRRSGRATKSRWCRESASSRHWGTGRASGSGHVGARIRVSSGGKKTLRPARVVSAGVVELLEPGRCGSRRASMSAAWRWVPAAALAVTAGRPRRRRAPSRARGGTTTTAQLAKLPGNGSRPHGRVGRHQHQRLDDRAVRRPARAARQRPGDGPRRRERHRRGQRRLGAGQEQQRLRVADEASSAPRRGFPAGSTRRRSSRPGANTQFAGSGSTTRGGLAHGGHHRAGRRGAAERRPGARGHSRSGHQRRPAVLVLTGIVRARRHRPRQRRALDGGRPDADPLLRPGSHQGQPEARAGWSAS